jgi:UDP-N-acetylmuramoyl-tripeptide--D-alanyl-D-alanine ligase
MKPLTIRQIRQVVQGQALTAIPDDVPPITAVCTDTRRMDKASLFVALRGERFNAHDYIPQAAAGGAIAALVEHQPTHTLPNVALIQVKDTRAALGKLARHVRQSLKAKVIAVAGSNGKTSTKHLIDAGLSVRLRGSISPKSFNNDIGVPLTIFPADPTQDYLVLEMGTNHPGEIKNLSDMALPDVAVITNCGAEHLEGLHDLMGVRLENASLTSGLKPDGLLVVNGDDADLLKAVADYRGKRITFGFKETNDLFASDIEVTEEGTRFRINNSRREVFIPMLGRHSACNALAAIAVGRRLGVPEDEIIAGLAHATGPEMRLQLSKAGEDGEITILNDAYNANPNSMKAALETARSLPTLSRRVAILGDMRELGHSSDRYHREIGQFAAGCGFDLLVCVGEQSKLMADGAAEAGQPAGTVLTYPDAATAANEVPRRIGAGDLVLVKASRGIRLEQVAQALAASRAVLDRRVAS